MSASWRASGFPRTDLASDRTFGWCCWIPTPRATSPTSCARSSVAPSCRTGRRTTTTLRHRVLLPGRRRPGGGVAADGGRPGRRVRVASWACGRASPSRRASPRPSCPRPRSCPVGPASRATGSRCCRPRACTGMPVTAAGGGASSRCRRGSPPGPRWSPASAPTPVPLSCWPMGYAKTGRVRWRSRSSGWSATGTPCGSPRSCRRGTSARRSSSSRPTPAGSVSPYCLGLVLPGVGEHPVATFDRIRAVLPATPGDI